MIPDNDPRLRDSPTRYTAGTVVVGQRFCIVYGICFAVAILVSMFAYSAAIAGSPILHPVLRTYPPLRIALPEFVADSPAEEELARTIPQIVGGDLALTKVFVLNDPATFVAKCVGIDVSPSFVDWRSANSQRLLAGSVARQPDGRIRIAYRFWDMFGERQLTGMQYSASPDEVGEIGHRISAEIYEYVISVRKK